MTPPNSIPRRFQSSAAGWLGALVLLLALAPARGVAQKPPPPPALAAGQLLVASPRSRDPRFQKTVILLIEVNSEGTAGMVLNQPGNLPLAALFASVDAAHGRTDHAYWGGPVEPTRQLCLLNSTGPLREARQLLPGLFFSTTQALMRLALNAQQPSSVFRVYLGYTGWGRGQLQAEIAHGGWTVLPGSIALVFDANPATLWTRLTTSVPAPRG
ncbi:MAG: YqgE/AlgH family protein [Terriglobales bacterium]